MGFISPQGLQSGGWATWYIGLFVPAGSPIEAGAEYQELIPIGEQPRAVPGLPATERPRRAKRPAKPRARRTTPATAPSLAPPAAEAETTAPLPALPQGGYAAALPLAPLRFTLGTARVRARTTARAVCRTPLRRATLARVSAHGAAQARAVFRPKPRGPTAEQIAMVALALALRDSHG